MDRCDVVIVGAGMAGMGAAYALRDRDIRVLEAQPFVGGRMHSVQLDADHWYCLGAQYIPDTVQELAREVGVEVIGGRIPPPALLFRGKRVIEQNHAVWFSRLPLSLKARLDLVRIALRVMWTVPRLNKLSAKQHERMEQTSLLSWLGGVHPQIRELIDMWASMAGGKSADDLSAIAGLSTLQAVIGQPGAHHGPAGIALARGGTARVCEAVAERLPGGTVQTNAKVVRVDSTMDAVTISYVVGDEERAFSCKSAIVTVPAPVLPQIIPDFPDERRRAVESMHWQRSITLGIRTAEHGPAPWDRFYWMRIGGPWITNVLNPAYFLPSQKKPGSALSVLCGGQSAEDLWDLADEEIKRNVGGQLTEVFPEMQGLITDMVVHRHPYAYASVGVGYSGARDVLNRPWKRIHFAGDYLSRLSTGEALASGRLAAQQAAESLTDPGS